MAVEQHQEPEDTEGGAPILKAGIEDAWLAENIRERRLSFRMPDGKIKMPQGELARRMADLGWPWSQQTTRKVEDGTRKVAAGEAAALARIFGTSVDRLMMPGREASAAALLERTVHRALEAWEQVSSWTGALDGAQRQLSLTVAETERSAFRDSPLIAGLLDEAREALKLTADDAVKDGLEDQGEQE